MNKKGIIQLPVLLISLGVGLVFFGVPLFKTTNLLTSLLKNPIIVLLLIIGFFAWAMKK